MSLFKLINSKKMLCLGLAVVGCVLLADSAHADRFQRWRNRRATRYNSYSYQLSYPQTGRVIRSRSNDLIEHGYGVESSPRRDHGNVTPSSHQETHYRLQQGYGVETSPNRSPGHYGGAVQIGPQSRPVFNRGYSQETTPQR